LFFLTDFTSSGFKISDQVSRFNAGLHILIQKLRCQVLLLEKLTIHKGYIGFSGSANRQL